MGSELQPSRIRGRCPSPRPQCVNPGLIKPQAQIVHWWYEWSTLRIVNSNKNSNNSHFVSQNAFHYCTTKQQNNRIATGLRPRPNRKLSLQPQHTEHECSVCCVTTLPIPLCTLGRGQAASSDTHPSITATSALEQWTSQKWKWVIFRDPWRMTHGHYPYAWDKEGCGMVVLDNPLGLQSKKS